ncbi:MAG: hypothetical protein HQ565_07860 [Bacteroidetes bacterium]|nr:hypothetical protein [Bacteroidota bacterium]
MNIKSQDKDPKDNRTFEERFREAAKRAGENIKAGRHPESGAKATEKVMELIHHPFALIRLEWMQDNQPEVLKDLYRKGTLKQRIEEKVYQAINHKNFLINEEKMDEDTAIEFALDMIAPADEMDLDSNAQMSGREFQMIINQLRGD